MPLGVGRIARARAPLRLGLAGGGTDLPAYADRFGGVVLNATIDRYAFASVQARDDDAVVFAAGDLGRTEQHAARAVLATSGLDLHRGVYERMVRAFNGGAPLAVTVTSAVDAPLGSGLGASSALTVALIAAYVAFLGRSMTPREYAALACDIERRELGLPGGQQDQYAAAYGGVNLMRFPVRAAPTVIDRLRLEPAVLRELEASLVLSFSGESREGARIIVDQTGNLQRDDYAALAAMHRLKEATAAMRDALLDGDLEHLAAALDASWQAKKETAQGIVTPRTAALEQAARVAGASAVKISGAGGGGFAMCLVPPERRAGLIAALQADGYPTYAVALTEKGCESWLAPRSAARLSAPQDGSPHVTAALPRPSYPVPARQGREAARV